jgi:hypothetical protein
VREGVDEATVFHESKEYFVLYARVSRFGSRERGVEADVEISEEDHSAFLEVA